MHALTRWIRHLWLDATDARKWLSNDGLQRLEKAVQDSEARHMGELRLCVEAGLPVAALWHGTSSRDRAVSLFSHLRVWDTEHNNGVLIYLLLAERRIEILADRGLHEKVGEQVWLDITTQLSSALQNGRYEDGLTQAIEAVGKLMRQHCPLTAETNRNELPDAVVLI